MRKMVHAARRLTPRRGQGGDQLVRLCSRTAISACPRWIASRQLAPACSYAEPAVASVIRKGAQRRLGVSSWRHAGGPGPAPSLFHPRLDQAFVSTGQAAQLRGGTRPPLLEVAFVEAEHDPGDLREQVRSARGEVAEFGHRGSFLVRGQGAPAGVTPGGAGDLGHKEAVTIRAVTILSHSDRIEYGYVKFNLNSGNSACLIRRVLESIGGRLRYPGDRLRSGSPFFLSSHI